MKKRIFIGLGLAFVALFAMFSTMNLSVEASNSKIRAYNGKLDDGRTIEVTYVESTKKLGVLVKDADGNNLSSVIFNNVTKLETEFKISEAYRKFGEDISSFSSIKVKRLGSKSAKISFGGIEMNLKNQQISQQDPVFGECTSACMGPGSTWGTCYLCCLTSTDC